MLMEENDQQGAIEQSGCAELNDIVILCYERTKDWRRCSNELQNFRDCYQRFEQRQIQPKKLLNEKTLID